jgi:uncharacterized protein
MSFVPGGGRKGQVAEARIQNIVHLELRTPNLPRAYGFYSELFGWRAETIHAGGQSYVSLDIGGSIQGGVVESESALPLWIPYVAVEEIDEVTERARALGAVVTLEPREGPAGWHGELLTPSGAELGLWQPK